MGNVGQKKDLTCNIVCSWTYNSLLHCGVEEGKYFYVFSQDEKRKKWHCAEILR